MDQPAKLVLDALQMTFFQSGQLEFKSHSTWVHEKTVPFLILAQASRGNYEVGYGGKSVFFKHPQVFVTPPNTRLRITHHPDQSGCFQARWAHCSCVLFHAIDLADLLVLPRCLSGNSAREFAGAMAALDALGRGLTAMAKAREIKWHLARLACESAIECPDTGSLLQAGERLLPLMVWLRANLSRPITVADMCKAAGMSAPRLYSIFRKRLGQSPQNLLKNLRLNSASALLVSSDMCIKEIAAKTGFANQFHLSREFRRRFATTPREFRWLNACCLNGKRHFGEK